MANKFSLCGDESLSQTNIDDKCIATISIDGRNRKDCVNLAICLICLARIRPSPRYVFDSVLNICIDPTFSHNAKSEIYLDA